MNVFRRLLLFRGPNSAKNVIHMVETQPGDVLHYPCLCEATKIVLFWSRLVGILPVVAVQHKRNFCVYKVSKQWLAYSYVLQLLFCTYMVTTYVSRAVCGPNSFISSGIEWYVMTFGYFMGDLDALTSLIAGVLLAPRTCNLLASLSKLPGSICESRKLQANLRRSFTAMLTTFLVIYSSFIYVGMHRLKVHFKDSLHCILLDHAFGVFTRGTSTIIPTVQTGLILMLILIISRKFQNLSEVVTVTTNNFVFSNGNQLKVQLEQLTETYRKINACVDEMNKCVGTQLLVGLSANLYTIIYYFYRYITSHESRLGSVHERIHCFIGLSSRTAKMFLYIAAGYLLRHTSELPLEVIRNSQLINLPSEHQQQVQTIILQWLGNRSSLSALGVVHLGPWLLAPIVGNVITYLLVALQFQNSATIPANVTSTILESIF